MMRTRRRALAVAEAHAHDLLRRRVALLFLIGLPLMFYATAAGEDANHAMETGTVAAAFSVVGAGIFTALAGRSVDQRLLLVGYRSGELLAGRLLILSAAALPILLGTTTLLIVVSHPDHPVLLAVAALAVGVVGVPLGLVVGLSVPRDLEAVLVLIGLVGVQLSLAPDQSLNDVLPFGGPRRLVQAAVGEPRSVVTALVLTASYAITLLVAARAVASVGSRLAVNRHRPAGQPQHQ